MILTKKTTLIALLMVLGTLTTTQGMQSPNDALWDAAKTRDLEKMKKALKNGAEINTRDKDGNTPLLVACWHGYESKMVSSKEEVVKFLVDHGADIDAQTTRGETLIDFARNHVGTEIFQFLQKVHIENQMLWLAVELGDLKRVEDAIQNGAQVNWQDAVQKTPLHVACQKGHREIIQYLIEKNANIEAKSYWGKTPLHMACQLGNLKIVKYLIKKKANIAAEDTDDETPLFFADSSRYLEIANFLVAHGAKISSKISTSYPTHCITLGDFYANRPAFDKHLQKLSQNGENQEIANIREAAVLYECIEITEYFRKPERDKKLLAILTKNKFIDLNIDFQD